VPEAPLGHLYQYPASVASFAVERDYGGERAVFFGLIRMRERKSLAKLTAAVRHLQRVPVESHDEFRRILWWSRMPGIVRRQAWWLGLN
jgi:hypothetical protein